MDIRLISIILGSSLLTGIVTSLFIKFSKDKDNKLQYITNDRKKWRDELRIATLELRKLYGNKQNNSQNLENADISFKSYSEIKTFFQVRLNPCDEEDNKILKLFDDLINSESLGSDDKVKKIEKAIASLLKFDWERAKKEAKPTKLNYFFSTIIITILYLIFRKTNIPDSNPIIKYLFSSIIEWKTVWILLVLSTTPTFLEELKLLLRSI